jgi:hypothetical protein
MKFGEVIVALALAFGLLYLVSRSGYGRPLAAAVDDYAQVLKNAFTKGFNAGAAA